MTYDRRVLKLDANTVTAAHRKVFAPLRKLSDAENSAAYTVAYWRFENGQPGQLLAHDRKKRDGVAAIDVTGHGNHVYAFARANAPRHSQDVPVSQVPRLGLLNQGSLDDTAKITGPTRDLFTDPKRSRTHMNALNTYPFNQWTIELSVNPLELGRTQTLLGKDGRPTTHDNAPLQVQIGADNRITVVAIDVTNTVRSVASCQAVEAGRWYHVVAVSDGSTLRLLIKRRRVYEEQQSTEFIGPLASHDGTWTIGRGFHNGKLAFDARAFIDEVRVSAIALPIKLLLWQDPS